MKPLVGHKVSVEFSPGTCGRAFANGDAAQQAEFLLAAAEAVEFWLPTDLNAFDLTPFSFQSWPFQCHSIAEAMTPEQKQSVARLLNTLIDYLCIPKECKNGPP